MTTSNQPLSAPQMRIIAFATVFFLGCAGDLPSIAEGLADEADAGSLDQADAISALDALDAPSSPPDSGALDAFPADVADAVNAPDTRAYDAPDTSPDASLDAPALDAPPDTACPVHNDGLGDPYGFCAPLGTVGNASTYSLEMARAAASAWPHPVGGVARVDSCGGSFCVFRNTADACGAWCYSGELAGRVYQSPSAVCLCPMITDRGWE